MKNLKVNKENLSYVSEDQSEYIGFVNKSEDERLKENITRTPIEKLQLFTRMIRRESLLKNAKISHT